MSCISINDLNTGDILLFHDKSYSIWKPLTIFGKLIEYFTKSSYSHIGIILKILFGLMKNSKEFIYGNLHMKAHQIHKIIKQN